MSDSKVVSDTVSLFDYQFLWEKFKAALDERDKAHDDYRALEEQSAYFRKEWNKAEGKIASLEEELASIKARVDSMQDRIDAYQEKGLIQ